MPDPNNPPLFQGGQQVLAAIPTPGAKTCSPRAGSALGLTGASGPVDLQVCLRKNRVATRSASAHRQERSPRPTSDVLQVRDRLQMGWIYAHPDSTEVVKFQAVRDWTHQGLPCESVGIPGHALKRESGISLLRQRPDPEPTSRHRTGLDLGPEARRKPRIIEKSGSHHRNISTKIHI